MSDLYDEEFEYYTALDDIAIREQEIEAAFPLHVRVRIFLPKKLTDLFGPTAYNLGVEGESDGRWARITIWELLFKDPTDAVLTKLMFG